MYLCNSKIDDMKPRLLILVLTLSTAFAATAQQPSLLAEDNLEPHTLRMLTSRPHSQRDLVAGCRHLALEVEDRKSVV